MLAIIGLLGVAMASVMITDSDRVSETDEELESTSGTLSDEDSADTSNPLQAAFEVSDTAESAANGTTLLGTERADILHGGDGDDLLDGAEGEDILHGCLLYTSPSPRDRG